MVFLYFFIALATERATGISDLIERIWYMIKHETEDPQDTFELIKSFIEISVNKWEKYFTLWERMTKGKTSGNRLKYIILKIPTGTVSLFQFAWISIYMIYHSIIGMYLPVFIPAVMIVVVEFVGLGIFILTSGNIIGLKSFLTDVFECFAGEKKVTQALSMLESHIIVGARHYGFLKGRLGFIADKYKIEKEALEELQVAKADLQITKLQEAIDKLQKEIKKKNGGKKK